MMTQVEALISQIEPLTSRIDAWVGESRDSRVSAFFTDISCRSNIPRRYVSSMAVLLVCLFLFFSVGQSLLSLLVGVIWPAYMSMKALESPTKDDDVQWCVSSSARAQRAGACAHLTLTHNSSPSNHPLHQAHLLDRLRSVFRRRGLYKRDFVLAAVLLHGQDRVSRVADAQLNARRGAHLPIHFARALPQHHEHCGCCDC
jgi:hypothetical protein